MTEQEYTERNELISDFLELRYIHGYHTNPIVGAGSTKILEYHHNRNWLHKAWERFRDLTWCDNDKAEMEHAGFKQTIAYYICYGDIDSAFQSIVSGIQWYNQLNK